MLKDSIDSGPYQFKSEIIVKDTDGVTEICQLKRLEDLAGEDKLRYDSDVKAVNILLLGLPVDIYTLINHYQTVKEIWDRVKELIEGTEMTKQECQSMLFDEFGIFTSEPGESIHSYYLRFTKLINDMRMIPMTMLPMQINTKFMNLLQPEWSRFVTTAKQEKDLHSMLLTQAQEAGVVLNEEQQDLLADSLEEINDCEDLQLQATTNFKANHVELNHVMILTYTLRQIYHDSDMLNEVPHHDSNNESYNEHKGNNDVISYTDYMLTIGNDEDNYVPPPVQKNDMMLSVIKQMKSQVEKCNMVNQESKSVNESLTSELERYKDRIRILEYAVKDGHSEQEAYLSRELYSAINDRNRKVADFEKQVFSQQTQMKDLNNHITFLKKNFETLKKESSERYEKNISEIVDLENAKKELENIIFKVGQSAQTMHMLTKP
ncbi:hypothetical protein Tco_1226084 [Tanacetum coccineum]